jgi:DNA-binding transcriptional LysR family regulator
MSLDIASVPRPEAAGLTGASGRPAVLSGGRGLAVGGLTDLSLRQLFSFRAVATIGSFHGAAAELDYTQSAVSQHVAALEAVLGVRLLERSRGRRTVEVTEAGRLLLRHVDAISDRVRAATADLDAYAAGALGTLRIGTYQSAGARVLPTVLQRFAEAWPDVDVQLTESGSDRWLLELVEAGELDLAFGILPLPDGPFDAVVLLRDPYMLVAQATSPFADLVPCPPLLRIAELPLIGYRSCVSTDVAEADLRRAGGEPRFVFRSDDNGTVQAMAGAGVGVALVPLLAVDAADPSIAIIPTDLRPRGMALAWHRDRYRSPAGRAFVDIAVAVGAELQRTFPIQAP